ncbi:MAG TPA: peptidyl-prolyl cis-trans isomerase [Methyloceanibacter sp.]|nr:peptidyl-prolyl cis-trans isomerase [Methyloceanibacter sp.]
MALESLRKSAGGVIGVGFVLILIASFIIWFPAGWFQGYGTQDVITVGDVKIGPQQYMRAQQDMLRVMSSQAGRSLSLQEARALGLDRLVVARLVGGAAIDMHTRALKLGVSDAALLDEIMKDPVFQDGTGKFSPASFQQALYSLDMNEQGFLASMREQNLREQILTTVGEVVNTPVMLVEALNRYVGESRTLRYVLVPASAAGTIPEPSDEDLKRYYENNKGKFTQPEFRKVGVLAVTPETVKDRLQITDADINAAFETKKDKLGTPEKRLIQQIIFPDLAAANAAYQKIQSGADFLAVAKDQGLSDADIDLGTLARAELADSAIAEAAFALEPNKVSEPVTGKLGSIVLLRVTAVQPGKTVTLEESKASLEKALLKERASGVILDLHDKIEDQLASGATLAEIGDKLKLSYQVVDQVNREGRRPDGSAVTLPQQTELLNAVFATDAGVENDPIDAQDDGIIWYEVMGVVPEQLKLFDQVKDKVAKNWRAEAARTKAAKYAQELVASLNAGKTLEDIAKDLNVEVLTSDPLKRESITVNVLPASVQQAFALPEKGYGSGPSGVEEGRIIFQVDKVTPPEALDDKERERITKEIELLLRQDAIDEYSGALEKRYGVSINQQALAKLIGSGEEP